VSTIAETSSNHHLELAAGIERLGRIEEQFMVSPSSPHPFPNPSTTLLTNSPPQGPPIPLYEPLEDGTKDNIFISKSYDPSSHFETTTDDVRDIYRRLAGEELKVEGLREGIQVAAE
jgi:Rab GDP dissociation inhibitor